MSDLQYLELEARVKKLEEQVEQLTRKANPTIYQRCKRYLQLAGGNFPGAIDEAKREGDKEAVRRLENEMERMD